MKTRDVLFRPWLLQGTAVAALLLAAYTAGAHPYASGITNSTGTISFILNESADNVQVAFDNYTSTNQLGALAKGAQTFALGTHTNFAIIVSKAGAGIPFQISSDTNPLVNFNLPAGIAVNKNPKTGNFGRIYVSNSNPGANTSTWGGVVSRTTTQGVYLLNADQSDAVGQGDTGLTAGLSVDTTASVSAVPYKLSIGSDDTVYVGDQRSLYGAHAYNEAGSGIWMAAPDFSSGQDMFPFGSTTMFGGIVGKPCIVGSLAAGNLVAYAYECDHLSPEDPFVWRYDIGAGPLPWNTPPPTLFLDAWSVGVNDIEGDSSLSPDGTLLYVMLQRGTPGTTQPPLCIYRTNSFTGTTLKQANAIWNSELALGSTKDVFATCYSLDISADGQQLATANGLAVNGPILLMSLTNGMPDISTLRALDSGMDGLNATGGQGYSIRGVCLDAAGNVYAATRAGFFRVYSPGQSTVAVTANDWTGTNGTFSITKSALSAQSLVSGPNDPNLDLSGTIVLAEYYGGQYGPLLVRGVPFVNNNARVGGNAAGDVATPNFGTSQDAVNLATISASDCWQDTFNFSVPCTAGHSYKLQLLFHDNYSGTAAVRQREFNVQAGNTNLAWNLDLALFNANLTTPLDLVLTCNFTNTDGSALPIVLSKIIQEPMISGLILKDTTPGYVMPPTIAQNPTSVTNLAGQTVSFQAAALGTSVSYQWQAAPYGSTAYTNLINGGRYSGVTSNTLTIANIKASDGLDYVLKASNPGNTVLSTPASLGVTVLGGLATVAQPADLGLGVGTVVVAEYYGSPDLGPLSIGSTWFIDNPARMSSSGYTAGFTTMLNTPYLGSSQDATNLALISAMDAWGNTSAMLDFTIPTVAGRNYLLKLLFHDNVFNTVGTRVFSVNAGPQGGTLSQVGPQAIDLVNFGDFETQPADLMLTLGITNYNGTPIEVQMVGSVQNPLVSAVILQDVSSGTVPPMDTLDPQPYVILYSGHTTNLMAAVGGSALIYQWQVSTDGGSTWNNLTDAPGSVSGSATPTLSLTVSATVPYAMYHLVAHNTAGSVTTAASTVTVLTGPPQILTDQDLPASQAFRVGQTLALSVGLDGDMPFTYQWQRSLDGGTTWTPVVNGGRVSGATSNVLTIVNAQTNDAAIYQLLVQNDQSFGYSTPSAQDNVSVLYGAASFAGTGIGWTMNGSLAGGPPVIVNNSYTLTDDQNSETDSGFYSAPVYIGAFHARFVYQNVGGPENQDAADGGAFILQNDASRAAYLGGGGGALGYTGPAGPSFALCWDLYTYDPNHVGAPGWLYSTNGANVGNSLNPYRPSGSIIVNNTSPIQYDLLYAQNRLTMVMVDGNNNSFTSVVDNLDLPALLGANTAYVGFSGADGGLHSYQVVSNFTFVPLISLASHVTSTNTVLLSWEKNSGFTLESSSDLTSGSWQVVPVGMVPGQAVVPPSASKQFYRLFSPLP